MIKNQRKQRIRQIIASVLMGVLMFSFVLPEQIYAAEISALPPGVIFFNKINKIEHTGPLHGVVLFKFTGLSIASGFAENSINASTAESFYVRPGFPRHSRSESLSERISPARSPLLNRKQCFAGFLANKFWDTKRPLEKLCRLVRILDQQNLENNSYRGPPSSQI